MFAPEEKPSEKTTEVADFKRIAIPLIRRVYPQLIPDKIVGVQPLAAPTGLNFYSKNVQGEFEEKPKKKKKYYRAIDEPFEPQS